MSTEKPKNEKTKTLINLRGSGFHLPRKIVLGEVAETDLLDSGQTVDWRHNSSVELSEKDAATYLEYSGVVDADVYVKPGVEAQKLKEEIETLKKENAELKAELSKSKQKK